MKTTKARHSVLLTAVILSAGICLFCAQQQGIQAPGDDMSSEDEAFRNDLLALLDMQGGDEGAVFGEEAAPQTRPPGGEDEEDLLSLLSTLEGEESGQVTEAPTPQVSPTPAPAVDKSRRDVLVAEIRRLEALLERRSAQVDSLRRILDQRSARLAELQNELDRRRRLPAVAVAEPAPRRGGYEPILNMSGPFVEKYNLARQKFESFDYNGCIALMSELLAEQPDHPLADNAQYWIGESYYGLKQYQKALVEFQKVFAFEAKDKYDDAQLMIGLCYVRLNQLQMARSVFQEFLDTYAGSEYMSIAQRYYRSI